MNLLVIVQHTSMLLVVLVHSLTLVSKYYVDFKMYKFSTKCSTKTITSAKCKRVTTI